MTAAAQSFQAVFHVLRRKLNNFQKDPMGTLTNRLKAILGEKFYAKIEYSRPVYELRYWRLNRAARRAYAVEKVHMALNPLQRRIANDLRERGIALIHFSELFPHKNLSELQELAESHLRKPENREQIAKVLDGHKPEKLLASLKYFVIRLLGNKAVFDRDDKFVELALSDEILRIVCDYFGSFVRITDMDFWCNVPTDGPGLFSQTWHRDSEDKKLVKLFLWLRDVDESTGPFYYIPESHSGGSFSNFCPQTKQTTHYAPEGAVEKKFSEEQIKVCTGEAGTLILCDTTGLHKGGHPTKGLRLLFTALYSTNAGWDYGDRFSITGLKKEGLDPAAQYAIGRLQP